MRRDPRILFVVEVPGLGSDVQRGRLHPLQQVLLVIDVGERRYGGAGGEGFGLLAGSARRWVKNDRLNHAGYLWAFSALRASPGAITHYRRRRNEHGDWHAAAQRNLFNRMLGQRFHCLQRRELFDENTAFPTALAAAA
ncbi:hypothetical protein [Streptomyces kunmingensis]|uniref:hypothetical protein n=1 Tax=Streptomyces kunmingensis TaxID=68225 RepID=UPI0039838E79